MIPHETIDKLADTWQAVIDVCTGLTAGQWATATDCPGWSVQDNVSHLIGTERLLHGLPPTDHQMPAPEHVKNPIGEFNEREIDVRRSLTGDAVLQEWRDLVATRLATLRAADDAYFDAPAMTPTGPGTVSDFLNIRVLDCWAHEQDIRRALDRPGNIGTPAAAHTVDRLLLTLPVVVGKRAACPEGKAIRLRIDGPVERDVVVEVQGGRAKVVESSTDSPVATITMSTESFVLLALGRRTAAELGSDAIRITGDTDLGQRVVDHLRMMI